MIRIHPPCSRAIAMSLVFMAACFGATAPASAPANEFFVLEDGITDERHLAPDSQARALGELGIEDIGPDHRQNVTGLWYSPERERR
jgi:hypothetical protein